MTLAKKGLADILSLLKRAPCVLMVWVVCPGGDFVTFEDFSVPAAHISGDLVAIETRNRSSHPFGALEQTTIILSNQQLDCIGI